MNGARSPGGATKGISLCTPLGARACENLIASLRRSTIELRVLPMGSDPPQTPLLATRLALVPASVVGMQISMSFALGVILTECGATLARLPACHSCGVGFGGFGVAVPRGV